MTAWTLGWLGWIAWFAVEESLALAKGGTAATLSGHVWKWFGINGGNGGAPLPAQNSFIRLRRLALLAGLAWLTAHFLTGGVIP
jgi:hypothetical protein